MFIDEYSIYTCCLSHHIDINARELLLVHPKDPCISIKGQNVLKSEHAIFKTEVPMS